MPAAPSGPYGAPPSQGFGAGQQPPRFSAGSLISDGDLPEWLREPIGGQSAQQAPWGAPPPAMPAQPGPSMGQGWQAPPEPYQADLASQYTVRQPVIGGADQAPPPFPFGQPQPQQTGYAQPPVPPQFNQSTQFNQPGFQAPAYPPQPGYPPQQPGYPPQQPGYPPQQPGYPPQQPGYPPQAGYPQQQPGYPPQQPGYTVPQQPGYPQQPTGPANYPGYSGYPQEPQTPPAPVNAFPSIEQAGTEYRGPQAGGMAGHALLDQQALPNWLAGQPVVAPRAPVPSGMQARSLVDEHLLPKWLRDQPESAGAANVSEWIGASAAQEPMPSFLSEAYAQAPTARAPLPHPEQPYSAAPRPAVAAPQPPMPSMPPSPQMPPPQAPQGFGAAPAFNGGGQTGYAEDAPLPEWLRAQAGGADAQMTGAQEAPAHFAASDLIDPSALPDWVTQRAPAPQHFSSTHGWSAASPQPDASGGLAGTDYTGGIPATEYTASPDYGDAAGAQAAGGYMGWDDDASWGGGAQGDMAYGERGDESSYGRGRPLEPEELPPWLRGQGSAQAAGADAYAPGRNPWMAASQPEGYADGWNEGDGWGAHDGRGEQGWGDSAGWDAASGGGYDDHARDGGWSDAEARGGWSDQRDSGRWDEGERRQRGPAPRGRGEPPPRGRGGLPPRGYDERYDERYDSADDEMEYDEQSDPSGGQRGRGWLGFLRRDRR